MLPPNLVHLFENIDTIVNSLNITMSNYGNISVGAQSFFLRQD